MKLFQALVFLGVIGSLIQTCHCVGICETDEICGYTDVNLNIPFLTANTVSATLLTIESFRAESDSGFSLRTVGGINFNSDEGVSISTPGNIDLSAPVAGDLAFRGGEIHLNARDLITFRVADEAIIDTLEDIILSVPAGDIDFNSHFETKFSSVLGMIFSSSNSEVRVHAPEGTVNLRSDSIGLVAAGDRGEQDIVISSGDKMLVSADREFDLFSEADLEFNATTTLTINSKINNIELEAGDFLIISAESNVVSSAANDIVIESLLADMVVNTEGAFSMYARNLQHKTRDVSLSSEGTFIVDGSGHSNFISRKDHTLNIDNAVIVALDTLAFTGTSDGDITFDLNALDQTSSDLLVQAADLAESSIQFTSGTTNFRSAGGDIHMDAHLVDFDVNDDTVFSVDDFFMYGSRYHYTAGPLDDESGLIELTSGSSTTFDSEGDIQIHSDNSVAINSGTNIAMTSGDNFEISSLLRTSFLSADITFNAQDDFSVSSDSSVDFVAREDVLEISGRSSNDFIATTDIITNAVGDMSVTGSSITMESLVGNYVGRHASMSLTAVDTAEIDANFDDDQFTNVFTPESLSMDGTDVFFLANSVLSVDIPSANGEFTAADTIGSIAGEMFLNSITGSVHFLDGTFSAESDEGIYFRSGNELTLTNPNGKQTFSSVKTEIISGSSVSLTSDVLDLESEQSSIEFTGDNSVNFLSEGELDLSPRDGGDFLIFGGRVDIASLDEDVLISASTSFSMETEDYNSIEFDANDDFDITALDEINWTSKDINIQADSYKASAVENYLFDDCTGCPPGITVTTSDGDIEFNVVGRDFTTDEVTTILVGGNAQFTSDNFLAESYTDRGEFDWTVGEMATITATDSITMDSEGQVSFIAIGDALITGKNMDVAFTENNQEEPSDYNIAGDATLLTCGGDIRTLTGTFSHESANLLVSQIEDPCETCVAIDCSSPFEIVTHSELTTEINSLVQTFTATTVMNFQGGRVDFLAQDDLSISSATSINIASENEDSRLDDERDDRIVAGRTFSMITDPNLNPADGFPFAESYAINIKSVGFVDLPDTPDLLRAFEVEVYDSSLQFLAPSSTIDVSAVRDSIRVSAGPTLDSPLDLNPFPIEIINTRDLIVNGGEGEIFLHANGNIVDSTRPQDTGMEFDAVRGSFTFETKQANIVFSANRDQVTDSDSGEIPWIAGESITHIATEHDGQLLYNPLLDILTFDVEEDIMLTAGSSTFDSDITMTAARNFQVLTKYEQRFLSTGPNTNEGEDSIILTGDEGPIRFTTPRNQQIYASGDAYFESETDELTVTAESDISLISVAEQYYISQFDFPITVTEGDISLAAGGGGGSVDIISDDSQSIVTTASKDILFDSEDSMFIYVEDGLSFTTSTGDITFTQNGDLQNTHFHSEGSLLLQAFQPDGIQFTSDGDFVGTAKEDVFFDATDSFSIGSSSDSNTATEPTIVINAGDDTNAGIVFDVLGGMQWTVTRKGVSEFNSDRAAWTTGEDIAVTSNGPIRFTNEGEFDSTGFSIVTQALLTMNGGIAVELTSDRAVLIDADEDITFTATGDQSFDISLIRSENNLVVNMDTLTTSTGVLEGESVEFLLDVNGPIIIQNTIGDGGSFTFNSDATLDVESQGPISFISEGPSNIETNDRNSDIIFVSSGNTMIDSDGSISAEGSSVDFDSPHGITMESLTGDIEFIASDVIEVRANGTMTLDGNDIINIESGSSPRSNFVGQFNVSARGELTMTSQDEFTFLVTDPGHDITVIGDAGITIQNGMPTRPSDQGDIVVDSSNDIAIRSGDDTVYQAGRDVLWEMSSRSSFQSVDSQTFTSTEGTASTLIYANDDITIDANHEFTLDVMNDLSLSSQTFTWEQLNEEGLGGIRISSTGPNAPTTITSATTATFSAQRSVGGTSNQYLSFDSTKSISFDSSKFAHGGDLTFSNQGQGGMAINAANSFQVSQPAGSLLQNEPVIFNAFDDGSSGASIDIQTPSFVVNGKGGGLEGDQRFIAENFEFANSKVTGAAMNFDSASSLALISNGIAKEVSPAPNRRSYGILVESDDTIDFNAVNIMAESQQGGALFTASETFNIKSSAETNFFSGHDLVISTGFTVQPNAQRPDRSGIRFDGVTASSFRSNHADFSMTGEDVSWSASGNINIRSGGSISFRSSALTWTADGTANYIAEYLLASADSVVLQSVTQIEFDALEGIHIRAESNLDFDADTIDIQADNDILFTTQGDVEFDDRLVLPPLRREAGISGAGRPNGDKYRFREENQYPNCEERSFGVDIFTNSFCYCNFNKWRCMDPTL